MLCLKSDIKQILIQIFIKPQDHIFFWKMVICILIMNTDLDLW